mgnify:CR=1 FL=1|jgi:hypothetical protein
MTLLANLSEVIEVAKIDLLDQCIIKKREGLTQQLCEKISKLNREMDATEVFNTLMKGGRIYTSSYCYKIL